jgi:hypothetical protein
VDGSGSAGSEHENRVSPAPVFVASDSHTRFVDVAAGSNHNLAIQDTGKVMAWGALISVSNKGQLGLTKTEADDAASDALGAFGDDVGDSDTSVDDDDDGDEDFRGGGGGNGNGALLAPISIGLVKKASTLSMRVKKMPPQLTGSDVLVGGADPHPALQTPAMAAAAAARAAGRGETKPGAFTPRPGVGGGTKRQLAFPTDFAGETDLTHLGAIKVHTPSRASARFEAAQSGGLSSSSSSSGRGIEHAAMDFHPDSAKKTGVRAGQHTPRPGRDNRRGSEGAAHAGVPPPLFPSAASDQGDDRLSAPLHVQVNTPSVAAAKALRNLHGDQFATSQQEEEEAAAVESFAEEGEDGQELAPGALSPSSSGIHPAKLQSALKRTMHNFADHKFATLLRGLTSALGKQHLLAQASALTKWKLTIAVLQIQQRALVHIRDTKKGYDLLGARLIYRAVCKLSQKLLRRGFNALTLAMFMSRATERALGGTADARHDLVVRLRKMKEKDQLMKQRLQYHRNVMKDRLLKTTIRYGRDKLWHVLRIHQKHSLRDAFSTWSLHARVNDNLDRLRRGRLKLQVSRDQLRLKQDRLLSAERDMVKRKHSFTIFVAFQQWLEFRNRKLQEDQIRALENERKYMQEELMKIHDRLEELNVAEAAVQKVNMQRGGLVISAIENFADTLAHENAVMNHSSVIKY